MSHSTLHASNRLIALLVVTCLASPAMAVPISGLYTDLTDCDSHPAITFEEEIGDLAVFPVDEAIFVGSMPTSIVICVGDDGVPNDWEVRMTNVSSNSFVDLFFVADDGNGVGNRDGLIEDVANAPGIRNDAFRIDNIGLNQPLIGGDDGDLVFEPGESWTFLVSNFTNVGSMPPSFLSPGGFAGSSTDPLSNASIVANLAKIPEPSTCLLAAFALGMAAMRRRQFI
ncbi:MAG: PEP-CTERM sorting domain-containing protein [Planctomycetales bacterium]|nr:PEP-CTERM sorting domain-containing protein [Planctomycetales bacterium]